MRIVIPSIPSDYARPYPELVLEGTLAQMRDLGNALRYLDPESEEPICPRAADWVGVQGTGGMLARSMRWALYPHIYVITCGARVNAADLAVIRATWVEHIHRTIHEQLGECQT